jgi:hypothetical protein
MPEDLDGILARFVDKNGKCKTCGHDHRFKPNLQNVNTSIDVISGLSGEFHHDKVKGILKQHA